MKSKLVVVSVSYNNGLYREVLKGEEKWNLRILMVSSSLSM